MPAVRYADIRPLFGLRLDDPAVAAFLARFPDHKVGKPSDGAQYVVARPLGFDLMFRPPTGYQGGRTKHLRVLVAAFLFREGKEKHRQFPDPPHGLTFADTRDVILRKLGPPAGPQRNPGDPILADFWDMDGLRFHADYDRSTMTPQLLTLVLPGAA
jgi:hypothetical protein